MYNDKMLILWLNSDLQNRMRYVKFNQNLYIRGRTESTIAYLDLMKNEDSCMQLIFNPDNGVLGIANKLSGSWTQINFDASGVQKLAFAISEFNGDILDISLAPGVYAVGPGAMSNPTSNYGLLIVIKYPNNNWMFDFLFQLIYPNYILIFITDMVI